MTSRDVVRDLARRSGWSVQEGVTRDVFSYVGGMRGVTAVAVYWRANDDVIDRVYQDGTRKTGGRPMLDGLLRDHV